MMHLFLYLNFVFKCLLDFILNNYLDVSSDLISVMCLVTTITCNEMHNKQIHSDIKFLLIKL